VPPASPIPAAFANIPIRTAERAHPPTKIPRTVISFAGRNTVPALPRCSGDRGQQTPQPISLIELWVRVKRRWQHFESFDPASPQFARSPAPADYAWFEAKRRGAQMQRLEPRIEAYEVRRRTVMFTDHCRPSTVIPPQHQDPPQ
jgi:hypothetical protein